MTTTKKASKKKAPKKAKSVSKKPTPNDDITPKMKSKKAAQPPIPDAASKMVKLATIDAIRERLYSSNMIAGLNRNHGLDRPDCERAIREVCEPIIEQLEK